MLLPLAVGFVAVSLGTALALVPQKESRIGPGVRLVALVAALSVIGAHLLPEAFHSVGWIALLWLAAGAALPSLLHVGVRAVFRNRTIEARKGAELTALELGYVGLVIHRFGDGLSMGAVEHATASKWAELIVLLALAAHIVPVTTIMLFAIRDLRGIRSAVVRGFGLLVATLAGVVFVSALGASSEEPLPWVSALVAGLLLHVVSHEIPTHKGARAGAATKPTKAGRIG